MIMDNRLVEAISIEREVRQECILSTMLFNDYSKRLSSNKLWKNMTTAYYSTVAFTDVWKADKILMSRITDISQYYGLDINPKTAKYMLISKLQILNTLLTINNHLIGRIESVSNKSG